MNPSSKNFAIFPVSDWIAPLITHISNKGEQLVRYYGYHNSVIEGKKEKYFLTPGGRAMSSPIVRVGRNLT